MDETDGDNWVAHTAARHAGAGWRIVEGSRWLNCLPEGSALPAHGWKLHVSSRTATFTALVERLLPVLSAEGCAFKLARSRRVLEELNDGITAPASVGKAFTIYPEQDRVRDLGARLADVLLGWEGPRILSDRRVRPDAPVYYRYGPFLQTWELDERGMLAASLRGPDGEQFDADATLGYREPAWVTDPFGSAAAVADGSAAEDDSTLVGGRYRIGEGIAESARGSTYRAIDQRDGAPVVVKQARALVDERPGLGDVRLRLRNERRVLGALDGVSGVPRFIDHFRHGDDEFLVTGDCGPRNLGEDVVRVGRYPLDHAAEGTRTIGRLAATLARIVSDLHGRGVFMRDIAPKNIVVDGEDVHLIDFGMASLDGVWFPGGTPGYAPARQRRGEPPLDTDDLYALGMTLLLALEGISPVTIGDDPELPRLRALQYIRTSYGATPGGLVGAIADLLDEDAERARRALSLLAAGTAERATPRTAPLPTAPRWTPSLASEITGNLLEDLLGQTAALLNTDDSKMAAHDASVHNGSAGPGLELLHHLGLPKVEDHLRDLVSFTVGAASRTRLRPGLFIGSTGVAVFLRAAGDLGIEVPGSGLTGLPEPGWIAAGADLISGAAGVGIGHLMLHRATGDQAHLAAARQCAEMLRDGGAAASVFEHEPLPASAGIDRSAGRAHGTAGVVEFWLAYAEATGDEQARAAAVSGAAALMASTRPLSRMMASRAPGVVSLAASWCQGLAGIGMTLLHASDVLGDPEHAAAAREAGDACIVHLPHVDALGQCCGLSGVGNFLIDLAAREKDERCWNAAGDVAARMLARSAGSPGHPVFVDDTRAHERPASWSSGLAGILAFFRRLSQDEPSADAGSAGFSFR